MKSTPGFKHFLEGLKFVDQAVPVSDSSKKVHSDFGYLRSLTSNESSYLSFPTMVASLFLLKEERISFVRKLLKFVGASLVCILSRVHLFTQDELTDAFKLSLKLLPISANFSEVV